MKKLNFEDLFGQALGALVDENGGSLEAALDEMDVSDEERVAIKNWFGWESCFTVRCYNIDYCIELEDLESNGFDIDNMTDEEIEAAKQKIRSTLPEELTLDVECTEEDLEDVVVDVLSDETGWLINSYDYAIISEN